MIRAPDRIFYLNHDIIISSMLVMHISKLIELSVDDSKKDPDASMHSQTMDIFNSKWKGSFRARGDESNRSMPK